MKKFKRMNKKNVLNIAIFTVLFVILALYLGYFPGVTFSQLHINYSVMGNLTGSILNDENILYPYGGRQFECYGIFLLGKIINFFVGSPVIACSLTYMFIFLISYLAFLFLIRKFLKSAVLIFGAAVIFYLNPFFRGNIPQVGVGALLITLSLLMDYRICERCSEKIIDKWGMIDFAIQFLVRLFIISISWYTGVIIAVFSCLWSLIFAMYYAFMKKEIRFVIKYLIFIVIPWFIAMLCLLLITPGSTKEFTSSLEFFNACSVSVLSMFLPSDGQILSNLIPSYQSIVPDGYVIAGDGTCWNNYIGYSVLISAIIAIIIKSDKKEIKYAIGITSIIGLFLAMGPGLKIIGLIPETDVITISNYSLDFSEVLKFPWAFLYLIFPFNIMRAVYRWLLIFRIGLLLLAFWSWSRLWKYKMGKIWVIFLMFLAVIEYYPNGGISKAIDTNISTMEALEIFTEDVAKEMDNILEENELIAVCSYGEDSNGYMLAYLAEICGIRTYAGCGDKAKYLSQNFLPSSIENLQNEADAEKLAYYISLAFEENQCSAILMPFFNIRWESYYWPPSQETINKYKEQIIEVKEMIEQNYDIYETDYFLLIKNDSKSRYELINDQNFKDKLILDNEFLYQRSHLELDSGQMVSSLINFEANDDMLYYSICYSGEKNNILNVTLKEININGQCINENTRFYDGLDMYTYCEDCIALQEDTRSVQIEIFSDDEFDIKSFTVEGYFRIDLL